MSLTFLVTLVVSHCFFLWCTPLKNWKVNQILPSMLDVVHTVWKFKKFYAIQILREIIFRQLIATNQSVTSMIQLNLWFFRQFNDFLVNLMHGIFFYLWTINFTNFREFKNIFCTINLTNFPWIQWFFVLLISQIIREFNDLFCLLISRFFREFNDFPPFMYN